MDTQSIGHVAEYYRDGAWHTLWETAAGTGPDCRRKFEVLKRTRFDHIAERHPELLTLASKTQFRMVELIRHYKQA